MAVLRPIKLVIENYPEGPGEELEAVNNPEDPAAGSRKLPFSRTLLIEARTSRPSRRRASTASRPGARCGSATRTSSPAPASTATRPPARSARCAARYDPATRGGDAPDGRKVRGTHPLALGGARAARRGAPLRNAVHAREPDGRARGHGLPRLAQPALARGARGRVASSRRSPLLRPASACSSSASATSASTPTRGPARPSGTAPSRCATAGPRSRPRSPSDRSSVPYPARSAPMIGEIKVISGSAHPELARDICKHLGIDLCRSTVVRFSNENMLVQIEENVREAGRLRDPALVRAGLGRHPRAADHDRRAEARLGGAHHRGAALLPVRALRQEGPPAHLDHGAPDGRPAPDRGRRPRASPWTCTRRRCRASSASRPTSSRPRRSCATTCARAATSPNYVLVAGDVGESKEVGQLREPPEPADRDRGQAPLRRRRAGARHQPDRRRARARRR